MIRKRKKKKKKRKKKKKNIFILLTSVGSAPSKELLLKSMEVSFTRLPICVLQRKKEEAMSDAATQESERAAATAPLLEWCPPVDSI